MATTHRPVKNFSHVLKKYEYKEPSILDFISKQQKVDANKENLLKLLYKYLKEKQKITTEGKDKTTKLSFLQNPTNPLPLITNKYTWPKLHVKHPEQHIAQFNANPSSHKSSGKISDSFNGNTPRHTPPTYIQVINQ